MQQFYENLSVWVDSTASNMWTVMVPILFFIGLWLTIKSGFIQFRRLGEGMKLIFAGFLGKRIGKKKREGDVSPFAALSTALAATVGNGNIGGVATASTSIVAWATSIFGPSGAVITTDGGNTSATLVASPVRPLWRFATASAWCVLPV